MNPGHSKILLTELILPENANADLASRDLLMMGMHAGAERTETMWKALVESGGLRVGNIWQKTKGSNAVIECEIQT